MNPSSKKIAVIVISFASIALAAWIFFSPHLSIRALKTAVKDNDSDAISNYVDFPVLRENLTAAESAKNLAELKNSNGDNPFEAMGGVLGIAMAKSMMDSLVTPQTFAMIMKNNKQFDNAFSENSEKNDNVELTMGYKNYSTFLVSLKEKGSTDLPFKLTFKRHGLLTWKLSDVNLTEVTEAQKTAEIDAAAAQATVDAAAADASATIDAAAADAQATVDAAAALPSISDPENNSLVKVPGPKSGEEEDFCPAVDEYNERLTAAGLKYKMVWGDGNDADVPGPYCAYRITPAPGTEVPKGSTVTYRQAGEGE